MFSVIGQIGRTGEGTGNFERSGKQTCAASNKTHPSCHVLISSAFQGRVGVEEMANKGTSQLYDESIRLKFEFLIAALLQNGVLATLFSSLTTFRLT